MSFSNVLRVFTLCLFFIPSFNAEAQQIYERKATTVNNMGLSFTNIGTYGRPNVRNVSGLPSMEYPRGTGTEHMFEAGIWIGAIREGSVAVSTSAVTTSLTTYNAGVSGFEFSNNGALIIERSSLPQSPLFSPLATSHQDFIIEITDSNTVVEGRPIPNHSLPLYASVEKEIYGWNFGFTENLNIVKYTFTNNATFAWDSVYVGMYGDMVVRNVNSTTETGTNFFNKSGYGYLDTLYTTYSFDAKSQDNPSLNTYAGMVFLGAEYRGVDFHPRYAEQVQAAGYNVPKVRPSYWQFSAGTGAFVRPEDDLDSYNRMSQDFDLDGPDNNREALRTNSANQSYKQLISLGPFPTLEPGESFTIYFAWVAALKPDEFQPLTVANKLRDDDVTRAPLYDAIDWAVRLFEGQEVNGERQRFLVPEPPAVPTLHVELDAGKATLYWDDAAERSVDPVSNEEDFEGYRIYRTQLGDDIRGNIANSAQLIREYDIPGNNIGFDTGFESIRLNEPVFFDGDPTPYWYKFEVEGLLSGWQYQFSVTAFDRGDEGVPPLETSVLANAVRVFPGTNVNQNFGDDAFPVGVYPNPYRLNAAWDGSTPFTRRLMFYNLPQRAEVRVYTLAGEIVATLNHDAATYVGETRWFNDFSNDRRVLPGGEHAWDLLSDANQNLTTGLYIYSVRDLDGGKTQTGKLVIIK